MMKKIKFVLLALVLGFAVNPALAVVEWNNAGGDQLWSNPANWAGGVVPASWGTVAGVDAGLPGPIIDDTVNTPYVGIMGLNIGDSGDGTGTVTMTGGVLDVGTQATANFGGTGWVVIGFGDTTNPNTHGILNMQGGTLSARWDLMLSAHGGGDGTINQTGGEIWAHRLYVGWGGGTGQYNLDAGIIAFPFVEDEYGNGNAINIYPTGNIDIEAGQMHILGDFSAQMQQYIDDGYITGYDDTGTALVDYDNMISGVTVVYAVPEPATMILLGLGSVVIRRHRF